MPDYDFHTLSPVDFEELTRDLLQASEGIRFQSFKVGRDRGVDLRYATDGENRIVQCKHYRKSGYATLVTDLRREAEKISRMKPSAKRYILSTSVELSDANKEELAAVLGLVNTRDILSANDINNLLGLHVKVEVQHFKLWLASTAVLQRVLHNAEVMQTEFEFNRIRGQIPRFVQTRAYDQAAAQLARDRILVLSGLPGVGKSTLADFLVYKKFVEGYQPVVARNGFEEARILYREGVRQAFLYDDFLGATFLGEGGSAFVRNEDRAITDFMNVIAGDGTKLLILTTREHIFSEALEISERLRHSSIRDYRYLVRVGAFTVKQRGRILYNHAYFNGLMPDYVRELIAEDFFLKVIDHSRFSPRIIEWLTTPRRVMVPASQYQEFALRLLDDPTEIWRHAYDEQISHAARSALLALHSMNGRASHERLRQAFDTLHAVRAAHYGFLTSPGDFARALRVLNSAFITISHIVVDYIDPSVRDLMNSVLYDVPDNCLDIIRGAVSMLQVSAIWALAETRDGEHILARMEVALPTLVDGVHRALNADLFFRGNGFVGTCSPAIEERLALLANIAGFLDNRALDTLIAPTVERTIEVWQSERPDSVAAIEAIVLLGERALRPHTEFQVLQRRLLSALVTQTEVDLEPSEMVRLLKLRGGHWLPGEQEALRAIAGRWPVRMGDRLRACGSDYELEHLADQLREVRDVLEVDLRGPIQAVQVELQLYGAAQEPQLREPEVPDPREYASRAERSATRSLFLTLLIEET